MLRAALGAAESFYLPAATALLAEHHGTETRATAMSIHSMGLNMGLVAGGAGVMIAGVLKGRLGLAGVFAAVGGLFVLAAGLLLISYVFFLERDIRGQLAADGELAATR